MNTQQQTDCLRGKIRDWLVISLQNGTISLNQATNVAQVTLDLFSDGLQDEQLRLAIKTMESHFPDFYADIHTAQLSCELSSARIALDNEVLEDIASGNLDSALDRVNKFTFK